MLDHVAQRLLFVDLGGRESLARLGHIDVEAALLELVVARRPPFDRSEIGSVRAWVGRVDGEPVLLVDEELVD